MPKVDIFEAASFKYAIYSNLAATYPKNPPPPAQVKQCKGAPMCP